MIHRFSMGFLTLTALVSAASADWLQFRGPGGLGISTDNNVPVTWGPSQGVVWKAELPGYGSSSPIVVGNRIVVTCYSGYGEDHKGTGDMDALKRHVVCLSRAGKILWKRDLPGATPETLYFSYQALHGYASSTPVSDGKHVYVFLGKAGVFAFDLEGKQLWQSSVGTAKHGWGSGTSPILYKDLLILNAGVESGALLALDKNTGKRAWTAKGKVSYSWNTPLLVNVPGGSTEVVFQEPNLVRGFNPDTGEELWRCTGIDDYVCPSLVAHNGIVYAIGARANTAIAIKAGGRGDVSQSHLLWTLAKGNNVSSPVYHDGHLYWAHDSNGKAYCVDAAKGKLVYEEPLSPRAGRIYASPLLANGKIYYVSRDSGTYVIEASPQFKQVAHNTLGDKSVFNGSPAVDNGQILLRSNRYLYCLGK